MAQPVWQTAAGSLGGFPSGLALSVQFVATPVSPAVSVQYALLSGELPTGVTISTAGLMTGTPVNSSFDETYTFAVRATDNLGNIRDRTFSMLISGVVAPSFTTPAGSLLETWDSVWITKQILYSNPLPDNPVVVRLVQGQLPPGLEINEAGLIRGYPAPPVTTINYEAQSTSASSTSASTDEITCFSTDDFERNRPVVFTGVTFGGIVSGITYYIKERVSSNKFTISASQDGPIFELSDGSGVMNVSLPSVGIGQPVITTYAFTLKLESPLGEDQESYQITVLNQNVPAPQGGPGKSVNTRQPAVFNTHPPTYNIEADPEYRYYILPPSDEYGIGGTYPSKDANGNPVYAYIGEFKSDNYFSFRILGHDFDGNELEYVYEGLPSQFIGNSDSGWITGIPMISANTVSQFEFTASVRKKNNPIIISDPVYFSFRLTDGVNGDIVWITPPDLGTMLDGTVSNLKVEALSEVDLTYTVVSGSLPPNLVLQADGEITGKVSFQPTSSLLSANDTTVFTFTVEAAAINYASVLNTTRTFTITVDQVFDQPTDILYIKAAPPIDDRLLLRSLFENEEIFPPEAIYRPNDPLFGKAQSVVFAHAYGIYASSLDEYVAAITKNHYWRNVTLGELSTAVAKNSKGEVIYEVVYSNVIDNLINPQGVSIPETIEWPRDIDLFLGPWYTSSTEIFTSWIWNTVGESNLITQNDLEILTENFLVLETEQGLPRYYTSLTSGTARILYPNSLPDMKLRVEQELGVVQDSRLLPLWMTSQQKNGSTLGFISAWVLCYTKPGYSEIIKNNIERLWVDPLGRPYHLNLIDFEIDRFAVDKSMTYNYDNHLHDTITGQDGSWTALPGATPVPDPLNSENFYVLFPRKTILPDKTQ